MRGGNSPTRWRASGAVVAGIMPSRGEYEIKVHLIRQLGADCASLMPAGECTAERLADLVSKSIRRALDEIGWTETRFEVLDVRVPGASDV